MLPSVSNDIEHDCEIQSIFAMISRSSTCSPVVGFQNSSSQSPETLLNRQPGENTHNTTTKYTFTRMCPTCVLQWEKIKTNPGTKRVWGGGGVRGFYRKNIHFKGQKWKGKNQGKIILMLSKKLSVSQHKFKKITGVLIKASFLPSDVEYIPFHGINSAPCLGIWIALLEIH